jgi:hypothetical protein
MLVPGVVVLVHCEAEQPHHLQLQQEQLVLTPLDPGKKVMLAIPDVQHPIFDQHA